MTDGNATIDDLIADLEVQTQQGAALVEELKEAWATHGGSGDDTDDSPADGPYLDVASTVSVDSIDSGYSGYGATLGVNGATSVTLEGNSWAAVPLPQTYTVTVDTRLDIDVLAETDEAEIVGFALWNPGADGREGFDVMEAQGFKVMGAQAAGDGTGGWNVGSGGVDQQHSFTGIEVASVVPAGDYTHIMLVRDHDKNPFGQVTFSNIQLREAAGGGGSQDPAPAPPDPAGAVAAAPWYGLPNNGTGGTSPNNVTVNGDTYVAVMDHAAQANFVVHAVSGDGSFDPRVQLNHVGTTNNHYEPAMIRTDSGTFLAVNSGHSSSAILDQHTASEPTGPWTSRDITGEVNPDGDGFTYATLFQHAGESGKPVYLITRMKTGAYKWGPWIAKSTDDGASWSRAVRLTEDSGKRPYWLAASDGSDTTHIFMNEDHPASKDDQGIHYAYWRGDTLYRADGSVISLPMDPVSDMSHVVENGDPGSGIVWGMDAAIDSQGRPVVTWTKSFTSDPENRQTQEAWWARLEGGAWNVQKVTDFIWEFGLAAPGLALDRDDPTRVVYATEVDGQQTEEAFMRQTDGSAFGSATRLTEFHATHGGVTGVWWFGSRSTGPRLGIRTRKNPDGTERAYDGKIWKFDPSPTGFVIDPDAGPVTDWPNGK